MTVLCRTTDKIKMGDRIMIRKSSPEKHAPFVYSGFGGGADGSKTPGIDAPVYMEPPKDDGSGTADADTIQAYLDKIVTVLKAIKGTETWDQAIGQSLSQLVTWRAPVLAPSDLPSSGNRIGDVRYVVSLNQLYVWTSSGWRSPSLGEGDTSSIDLAIMQLGAAVSAFTVVARSSAGLVLADVMNADHIGQVCGITTESGASGYEVPVQIGGVVRFPMAVFGDYRGPVLVGPAGTLVSVLPGGAKFVQQAGVAVGSNELILNLDATIIQI